MSNDARGHIDIDENVNKKAQGASRRSHGAHVHQGVQDTGTREQTEHPDSDPNLE